MLLEIFIALIIGICFGIFTGLTPGIHINLVAVTLVALSPFLLNYADVVSLSVFIISMSITHTFLDSIPSIFLGAPDEANALGVLPGHRYLLKGFGLMAVKLTIIGSFFGLLLSIILYPILIPFVKFAYPYLKDYVGYILIAISVFMLLRDRKIIWATIVFLISGALGVIILTWPNFPNPLFPLLSGLFGISTLLISIKDKNFIPEQKFQDDIELDNKVTIKALLSGQFSGFLTAFLPGISSGTASVLSLQITRKLGDHGFMILVGSIGMVNFVLSILTFQVLNKARNGSIVAIQQLIETVTFTHIMIFISVSMVAGGIAVFLTLYIGKFFSFYISKVNYTFLVCSIISFVVILTVVLTGFLGFIFLVISTAIGIIPAMVKVARVNSMGCLVLPVILFFVL